MNTLTELKEGLTISWAAIRANKLRSVLTTLGIVIGIVTVTLMGTAIAGLNQSFLNTVSFIGADVLFVSRSDWTSRSQADWYRMLKRRPLLLEQAQALGDKLELSSAVVPIINSYERIRYGKKTARGVTIIGTTDEYLFTGGFSVAEGRFLSAQETDGGRPVCVLGATVATNLFNGESALGKKITIDQAAFEVVGVLDKQGTFLDTGIDNQAVIPLQQVIDNFENTRELDQIQVKVRSVGQLEEARDELESALRNIRRLAPGDGDDFAINQQEQVLTMVHRVTGTIAAIGLFITGLSLCVGGIGIMNIMFVSVAERTREIGIRKAIGAKRRTILLQFLLEAACICLIGGLIALGIAWPLTLVVQKYIPATMSLGIAGLALLVSAVTGLLSGLLPAWRAARMNPVDALRAE